MSSPGSFILVMSSDTTERDSGIGEVGSVGEVKIGEVSRESSYVDRSTGKHHKVDIFLNFPLLTHPTQNRKDITSSPKASSQTIIMAPFTSLFSSLGIFLTLSIHTTFNHESSRVNAQSPITCEEALPARLDCFDTNGPCESLPLPATAFGPVPVDPTKGYFIQTLRQDSIYAISEGAYLMMAAVAPLPECKKSSTSWKGKGGRLRNLKKMMMKKNSKYYSVDKKGDEDCEEGYEVVIFDFPEGNFVVRDETGQTVGSLITTALDEIVLDMLGLEISEITSVKMVYSHQHMDHVGGATIVHDHIVANWMPSRLDIIGPTEGAADFTKRIAANYFSFRAPVPNVLVSKDDGIVTFPIGALYEFSLEVIPGHTDAEDLAVFIAKDETTAEPAILMYIDVVYPGWAPFFSFALTTDLFHFIEAHDALLHYDLGDDGIFVGGHLAKLGNRADIELSKDFTNAVMAGALLGLQTIDIGPIVAGSGIADPTSRNVGNSWLLFDLYFKEVVRVCAKAVTAEFGCQLGAVDVTIESHCRLAQSFWRIDY